MRPAPPRGAETAEDARWMRAALALARRGLGRVAPNPSVGAILTRDGVMLGRGVTTDGGRPHAETVAIAQARARWGEAALRGATAYVTLEPCAHHGLTPPCADALISSGVARLVSPLEDPDPRVSGAGFRRMAETGMRVDVGLMAAEAREVNAGFLSRIERGRPWLTLKLATTLDGRIATSGGESRWITGPEARARVHLMRAQSDAVLIGAGTARDDDPMLDIRGFGSKVVPPLRVVADPRLSLPLAHRLARTARRVPVWLMHTAEAPAGRAEALRAVGCRLMPVPGSGDGGLDPRAMLARLATAGVTRVLCEGGGRLAATLIGAGLVDELVLFEAGRIIGGDGRAGVGALGLSRLSDAPAFERVGAEPVGGDLLSRWRPLVRTPAPAIGLARPPALDLSASERG